MPPKRPKATSRRAPRGSKTGEASASAHKDDKASSTVQQSHEETSHTPNPAPTPSTSMRPPDFPKASAAALPTATTEAKTPTVAEAAAENTAAAAAPINAEDGTSPTPPTSPKANTPAPSTKPAKATNPAQTPAALMTPDELYARILSGYRLNTDITQYDMLSTLDTPMDLSTLMSLLNPLLSSHKIQSFKSSIDDSVIFRLRPLALASKLSKLTAQEETIYNKIGDAGMTGIWTRALKGRTQLHQTVLNRGLKALESQKLVKQVRNNREGGKKMYMLQELKAEEEAKGAGWYSDGDLDIELVTLISDLLVKWIQAESWVRGSKVPQDRGNSKKRKRDELDTELTHFDEQLKLTVASLNGRELVPHPPTHNSYPTASKALTFLENSGVLQSKDLAISDIQVLLDMLVFDGRLERIRPLDPSSTTIKAYTRAERKRRKLERHAAHKAKRKASRLDAARPIKPDEKGDLAPSLLAANNDRVPARRLQPRIKLEEGVEVDDERDRDEPMYRSVRIPDSELAVLEATLKDAERGVVVGSGPVTGGGPVGTGTGTVGRADKQTPGRAGKQTPAQADTVQEKSKSKSKSKEKPKPKPPTADNPPAEPPQEFDMGRTLGYAGVNAFSEVPCGRCPVFNLCQEGGPVNPKECGYLGEWLGI
ncbi:MAG: 34-kDa subunit of RNA polymerase III (C) [Chrysothrix sp. TS-e1954]|nr:MAG: 34-kDa subunit of RNA polymerase III (C) [Chrysothrix sp. TS-e1954]